MIQISAEVITARPLGVASPYRGLERFEDGDAALFFGRDQIIHGLLIKLSSSSIVLPIGAAPNHRQACS
jgi:hypothetical protein